MFMFYSIYHNFVACNVLNDFNLPFYINNQQGYFKHLSIHFIRKNMRKFYFVVRYLNVWNNLHDNVVCANFTPL